jgi:hypothetical protein
MLYIFNYVKIKKPRQIETWRGYYLSTFLIFIPNYAIEGDERAELLALVGITPI